MNLSQLTSSAEGFPVKMCQLLENEEDLMATAAAYGVSLRESFASFDHGSSSWKMSQACLVPGLDEFSETWPKAGTMRNGKCSMLVVSEFPSKGEDCSLSDILEPLPPYEHYSTKNIPQWFKGELERRTFGHHVSFHFLSGLRASSMEIFQFLSLYAAIHLRVLTVKECERLMGFPDDWTLLGTKHSGMPSSGKSRNGSEEGF